MAVLRADKPSPLSGVYYQYYDHYVPSSNNVQSMNLKRWWVTNETAAERKEMKNTEENELQ